MIQIAYSQILSIILIPLFATSLIYYFSLNKKHNALRQKYDELRKDFYTLEGQYNELNDQMTMSASFTESLKQAEVTTSLQAPRMQHSSSVKPAETKQQKYQHLQSLSASGMAAAEIASILSISSHEAEQMISLAKIANKN